MQLKLTKLHWRAGSTLCSYVHISNLCDLRFHSSSGAIFTKSIVSQFNILTQLEQSNVNRHLKKSLLH